jgi:hypothetical protein
MQPATTVPAAACLDFGGNRLIELKQGSVKTGIVENGLTHCHCLSLFLGRKTGDSPLE